MAGEYEPESASARLAQAELANKYQRAQYAKKTAHEAVTQSKVLAGHGDFSGAAMGQMLGSTQGRVANKLGDLCSGMGGRGGCDYVTGHAGPHHRFLDPCNTAQGVGIAQMLSSPGKMFSRVEILAVLKSRRVLMEDRPHFAEAMREIDAIIDIFTRME